MSIDVHTTNAKKVNSVVKVHVKATSDRLFVRKEPQSEGAMLQTVLGLKRWRCCRRMKLQVPSLVGRTRCSVRSLILAMTSANSIAGRAQESCFTVHRNGIKIAFHTTAQGRHQKRRLPRDDSLSCCRSNTLERRTEWSCFVLRALFCAGLWSAVYLRCPKVTLQLPEHFAFRVPTRTGSWQPSPRHYMVRDDVW